MRENRNIGLRCAEVYVVRQYGIFFFDNQLYLRFDPLDKGYHYLRDSHSIKYPFIVIGSPLYRDLLLMEGNRTDSRRTHDD